MMQRVSSQQRALIAELQDYGFQNVPDRERDYGALGGKFVLRDMADMMMADFTVNQLPEYAEKLPLKFIGDGVVFVIDSACRNKSAFRTREAYDLDLSIYRTSNISDEVFIRRVTSILRFADPLQRVDKKDFIAAAMANVFAGKLELPQKEFKVRRLFVESTLTTPDEIFPRDQEGRILISQSKKEPPSTEASLSMPRNELIDLIVEKMDTLQETLKRMQKTKEVNLAELRILNDEIVDLVKGECERHEVKKFTVAETSMGHRGVNFRYLALRFEDAEALSLARFIIGRQIRQDVLCYPLKELQVAPTGELTRSDIISPEDVALLAPLS